MVVVHRAYGYRFVIYTLDHEPAHIHLTGPAQAKINLLGRGRNARIGLERRDKTF